MRTACVFHSVDLDGWMSAAIVKHWFEESKTKFNPNKPESTGIQMAKETVFNTLDFIGYNYGQPIPDLSEYNKVIMCDISFPKEEMEELGKVMLSNFIWIDHHISAIKDAGGIGQWCGLQDTKFAACELTWKYFFPDETMPEIVRLLGRYDCFGHKGTIEETKVLEFQYGARARITDYNDACEYLHKSLLGFIRYDHVERLTIEGIIQDDGRIIYKSLCVAAEQTYKNGFAINLNNGELLEPKTSSNHPKILLPDFESYKFICINSERLNPINFGIDYHKEGYDGACCFHYDGKAKLWRFSLYNDNGKVDCSKIAKQYGGGGHAGASGFVLYPDTFNKFMTQHSL